MNRACPDLACDVVFSQEEWQPVWQIVKKAVSPRLDEFMKLVAKLGGDHNHVTEPPRALKPSGWACAE